MSKTVDQAIEELVAEITATETEVRRKKETVNTLCGVAGRTPAYTIADESAPSVPKRIRPDQFYGQPLASAVRTILDMRRQQDLGAALNNEIYDALIAGGFTFNTKSEDVARASLRNSLSKNTTTFHKLPNGRFGLLSWYPNVKASSKPAAGREADTEEEVSVEEDADEVATVDETRLLTHRSEPEAA